MKSKSLSQKFNVFVLAFLIAFSVANPAFSKSHFDKGRDLQRQERYAEAIEEYRKAIRTIHTSTATRKTGNLIGRGLGQLTEIATFGEYLHMPQRVDYSYATDDVATCYSNSGMCYYGLGNYAQTEECMRKALQLQPYTKNAHYYLGLSKMMQKDYWNAIDEFGKDSSREADSNYQIGYCYSKLNLVDEARGSWRKAADLDIRYKSYPEVARALKYLADDASRREKLQKAQLEKQKETEEEKFFQRMERRKQAMQNIN